ncbi:MAG: glycosyltransferase family 9 protein [Cryomorphaceae bacterium]|nr:glycosyltransferase family 9 protein [Cryomorphaceae bacterium]
MQNQRIAVVRFSALGDVLLLWPVIEAVANAYPSVRLTFFTRPRFLVHLPEHPQIEKVGLDVDKTYGNPFSLQLFWWGWLRSSYPVAWVDAHSHMRTRMGTWLAARFGAQIGRLQKHRGARKAYLRRERSSLPPVQSCYAEAFAEAGFPISWPVSRQVAPRNMSTNLLLAPFAAHASKRWNLEDAYTLATWWKGCGGTVTLMGQEEEVATWQGPEVLYSSPAQEAQIWPSAAVAVVMDSANQHLAALYQTPCVTLWMGTSPEAGFVPYNSSPAQHLVPHGLTCAPCSIYGTSTCSRGDFACRDHSIEAIKKAIQQVAQTGLVLSKK